VSYSQSIAPTWRIPDPMSLFSQAAGVYEATFEGIDARSANSVAATNGRIYAMSSYDLYLMQANLANELMPNTAVVWLPYHANIWQVPRLQPTPATGNAVFAGATGTAIPAGTLLSFQPMGWLYMTTAAATIGGSGTGTVSIPIISVLAGSAYNLPAGTVLQLVNPLGGVSPQSATLDSNGAANGTDMESVPSWRSRVVSKIGQPGNGGSGADYITWAKAAGAGYVNVVPGAIGAGSVWLYTAAPGPAVASEQLVAAVQNYLGVYDTNTGVRPVTARAVAMASTLVPVNMTLHLNPDTALTRAAATSAIALFFPQSAAQQNVPSGPILYMSRLDNAIWSGDGEYSHERIAPSTDQTFTASQMFVMGALTFE
jgi:uncharacterized phage protein gp47/JayE